MARQLSADWQTVYGHPLHYLETFVDRDRSTRSAQEARLATRASWPRTTGSFHLYSEDENDTE